MNEKMCCVTDQQPSQQGDKCTGFEHSKPQLEDGKIESIQNFKL